MSDSAINASEGEEDKQDDRQLELLAPAGDEAALKAALNAGADAVYFGLTVLNARRRARNFTYDQLSATVSAIHAGGAKAYLTLNVDIAEKELDIAARVLEAARAAGCDAILVRDPALLALRAAFPELEYHFSTQNCVTNSADVAASAVLGATRTVLAREMDLAEIAAASAVPGVETEVFVQGALCFSVSGCCLLSSWVGGRSGNRGQCASPCRVPWSVDGQSAGTPLSMRDLSAIDRLEDLRKAGVRSLKIEGRMKNAAWVSRAVSLYRRALAGQDPQELAAEAERLGAYTGRALTSAYLDGERSGLTGASGRSASVDATPDVDEEESVSTAESRSRERSVYNLEIMVEPKGIDIRCDCAGIEDAWRIPKTVIHRPHKAVSVETVFQRLADEPVHGCSISGMSTNNPEFLLVPRAVNAIISRISKTVQRGQKNRSELTTVKLPPAVQEVLRKPIRYPGSQTPLGAPPDRVRIDFQSLDDFLGSIRPAGGAVVDGIKAGQLRSARSICRRVPLVVSLPAVFFEKDIDDIRTLLAECARVNQTVEVNSWGGWHLAKEAGVRMEGGPGMAVLNSLAAYALAKAGIESVTVSVEGDRKQIEELTARCPLPTSLYVFARPPLMISRAQPPEDMVNQMLADRRDTLLSSRCEHGLWVLRPDEPLDLRNVENERIRVKHLVVDLTGSPDPLYEWERSPGRGKPAFHFNYDRGLD
jgi:putative protease